MRILKSQRLIKLASFSVPSFFLISETLQSKGFRKDSVMKQRFYFQNADSAEYEIDIVPFGGVAKDDQNIYWPDRQLARVAESVGS